MRTEKYTLSDGINLKEFNVNINLRNNEYCIEDRITGVKYYETNIEPNNLENRLKGTFKRIKDYRKWWHKIDCK